MLVRIYFIHSWGEIRRCWVKYLKRKCGLCLFQFLGFKCRKTTSRMKLKKETLIVFYLLVLMNLILFNKKNDNLVLVTTNFIDRFRVVKSCMPYIYLRLRIRSWFSDYMRCVPIILPSNVKIVFFFLFFIISYSLHFRLYDLYHV